MSTNTNSMMKKLAVGVAVGIYSTAKENLNYFAHVDVVRGVCTDSKTKTTETNQTFLGWCGAFGGIFLQGCPSFSKSFRTVTSLQIKIWKDNRNKYENKYIKHKKFRK